MAESVDGAWVRSFAPGLLALACLAVLALRAAGAEDLPDPTRPPAVTASAHEEAGAAAGPVLQSVLISPKRRLAVISGRTVALGEKYGNARLVRITESEAVLSDGSDTQVLRLFPQVKIHEESRANRERAAARRHEK